MADDEGGYCTICGGMVPKAGNVRMILVDGKKVGVSGLTGYWRLWQRWSGPVQVKEALLLAVKAANYVPTKKSDAYADALYSEYLQFTKQR